MQQKEELEKWYITQDPWTYLGNPFDTFRRAMIVNTLRCFKRGYNRALDIGAGEGYITSQLPATEIQAYEISDYAAQRLPAFINRVLQPTSRYDLITACGVLYQQYDYQRFLQMIKDHASHIVLTCSIDYMEVTDIKENVFKRKQVLFTNFKYREWTQNLRVFDFS